MPKSTRPAAAAPLPPRATVRLQLHRDFPFAAAAAQVPYLAALGISHVYASPILTARAGSMHGYDVTDPGGVNPELGGEDGLRALVATLRAHGMGLVVDIVPNHMAVGAGNPTGVTAETMPRWVTGTKPSVAPSGNPVMATSCPSRTPDDPLPDDALIAFYRHHAHRFTVIVPRACDATLGAVLELALEANKPAHTLHRLCWLDAGYRVGSASLVGISHIGPIDRPTPAVLGSAVLSTFTTLHRGRREDRYPYFKPMNPWEASP